MCSSTCYRMHNHEQPRKTNNRTESLQPKMVKVQPFEGSAVFYRPEETAKNWFDFFLLFVTTQHLHFAIFLNQVYTFLWSIRYLNGHVKKVAVERLLSFVFGRFRFRIWTRRSVMIESNRPAVTTPTPITNILNSVLILSIWTRFPAVFFDSKWNGCYSSFPHEHK
jgi:hypothetical protein